MKSFFTYLRLVATSGFGIVGDLLLAAWLLAPFVGPLEEYRWFVFAVMAFAFLFGGFSVYRQQVTRISELEQKVMELQAPAFSTERRMAAQSAWDSLSGPEKEAVKQLLIYGELDEKQAVAHLQATGIAIGMQNVFHGIAARTGLVQRTFQGSTSRENVYGYEGTYRVNPEMLEPLTAIIREED